MAGRNVLFIVADHLRADCVFGALAQDLQIPNIRNLMSEGVSFLNHYTVTVPCGPARASLLTGLYAMNHRSVRNGTPLASHHTNIALEARKAGYEPLLFGYTDTSPDPTGKDPNDPELRSYEGVLPGFNEITQLRFETSYPWLADLKAKGYALPKSYMDVYRTADPKGTLGINAPTLYKAEDSDTAFLTNETIKALDVRRDQNWFAHVAYINPHPPFAAPAPYSTMYDPDQLPLSDRQQSVDVERAAHPIIDAYFSEPSSRSLYIGFDGRIDQMSEPDRQMLRAVYLGLVSELDHHIGRLINYLKDTGQYDETLIVLTCDHGEMLGDHYMWGKESIYEPAYHVPLIIRDPDNRKSAGKTVQAMTESIDISPTLLECLDQEPPIAFNGKSLIPFLQSGKPGDWRDCVFAEIEFGNPVKPTRFQQLLNLDHRQANASILREEKFKLVHFNGGLPPLLFDLENDPAELENLAADEAHASELLRLTRKMLDHRMTHAHHALSSGEITSEGYKTTR